jgi:RND superfamily putative drug exporter
MPVFLLFIIGVTFLLLTMAFRSIVVALTAALTTILSAFIGLDFVTKLGIGSSLGVLTTVLIANSLLIAVLALLGHKVDRLKVPFTKPFDDSEEARDKTLTARWGRFVTRNAKIIFPVLLIAGFILAGTSALVRLGAADQGTQPEAQTSRRAYDLLAEGFGAGFNGPIPIVIDVRGDKEAPQRIFDGVQGTKDVASVRAPQFNDEKTVAIVFVTPSSAPQDAATDSLVDRLRNDIVPTATKGGPAVAYVSGQTAAFKDIADQIISRMPVFLLFIIGVTFLLLTMAFRSIVVALTAALTTILSAFIGFGVLGLVVQQGYLLGLTGLDVKGPIETFVPPIAFAILFGLSMDYMVFIMSRIREEHVSGLNTRDAVEHGISAIGRVVVAAALIMGTVFAAFVLSADRIPKEFGLLLAVAILTDALVVRMTLVPAFLTLLGEKSWCIPRWLDRILPNITIEPPHERDPAPAAAEQPFTDRPAPDPGV